MSTWERIDLSTWERIASAILRGGARGIPLGDGMIKEILHCLTEEDAVATEAATGALEAVKQHPRRVPERELDATTFCEFEAMATRAWMELPSELGRELEKIAGALVTAKDLAQRREAARGLARDLTAGLINTKLLGDMLDGTLPPLMQTLYDSYVAADGSPRGGGPQICDTGAMLSMAERYAHGWDVPQDRDKAVRWYKKAADLGDGEAMFQLGDCHAQGQGVAQDHAEAVNWFRKAVDMGNEMAMFELGEHYYFGLGVPQDRDEAVRWYRAAVKRGGAPYAAAVALSTFRLGQCYDNGTGVPQDHAEAVHWFREAACGGHAGAMFNLGCAFRDGQGVEQNVVEAMHWYERAADAGSADAMVSMGDILSEGQAGLLSRGQDIDQNLAVLWYTRAAYAGHAGAMLNLGRAVYETNLAEAVRWYRKAADRGEGSAIKAGCPTTRR